MALDMQLDGSERVGPRGPRRTSKSCRLRISDSGGRASTRSKRALSWSVTLISTLTAVPSSTGPKLLELSDCPTFVSNGAASLLLSREVVNDGIWRMDRFVFLAVPY